MLRLESLEPRTLLTSGLGLELPALPPDAGDWAETAPSSQVGEAIAAGGFSAAAEGEPAAEAEAQPDLVAFAKALDQAGVKYFGAPWCPHCTSQKLLFEDGGRFLPFINVSNPDRTINDIGTANNISALPTWEFPDGTRLEGEQSLETISQRAGVPIPTSSAPSIAPIDDATLLAGSPLHVPLDGYDPNGDPLTYTVTSDNPLVTPTVLEGNRSMRINVKDWGPMVFQLYEQRAPRPAGRVIELAQNGFYDGVLFHRVIDGFMIQGGDPTGTGSGGSDLGNFDDQFHVDLQHNREGVLSFAKSADDTNNSQFFITLDATRWLDFNHSIFGQLVEGEDVLRAIGATETGANDRPTVDVVMQSVEIFNDTENAVVMLKADPAAIGQEATITVTADDGQGNQAQTSFRVMIQDDTPENGGANGGPFLEDIGQVTTRINTPAQIQLSAVDVEGDPVYYDAAPYGTVDYTLDVDNTTGVVTVTPPDGFVGQMQVRVGVRALNGSDTGDAFDQQLVTIDVLGPDAPSLDLLPVSDSNIPDDNITNLTDLTFRVSNVIAGAQVQILSGGNVIGEGTATGDTIDVTTSALSAAGDGVYGLTAVQTISGNPSPPSAELQVTVDTTAPDFTSTPPTAATGGSPLIYDANASETGVAFSLVGAPDGALIDPATGVMTWTPTQDQGGVHNFQIQATDTAGNTATQDLSIDVTVVPQKVRIRLQTADLNGDPIAQIPAGQDFLLQGYVQDLRTNAEGVFAAYVDVTYDPNLVSTTAASLDDVTFGDSYQNGKSGSFPEPGLIDEVGAFGPTSPLGPPERLLFSIRMTADDVGRADFQGDPADEIGNEVLVFGENETVPWNAVTIVPASLDIGSGFAAADDLFNVDEDSIQNMLDVLANDTNELGGTLRVASVSSTTAGAVVAIVEDGARLMYTPDPNFFGEDTFVYTMTNGQQSDRATVTVQVFPANDDPTAHDDAFTVGERTRDNFLDVLANDVADPDQNETLRVTDVGTTSQGGTVTIAPNGTHLLYTPTAGFVGDETFTYTIGDGNGGTAQATVTVTVEAGTVPDASNDVATVEEDSALNPIDVLANDAPADGGTLTVTGVTQPATGGTVTIGDLGANVLYTPAPNFFGTDTFMYTVTEADGGSAQATVTVTITGSNDPPTANDDKIAVTKDSENNTLDVLANDLVLPDADETLWITDVARISPDQGGTMAIAADGRSLQYTPAPGFTGQETFTYTVSDRDDGTGLTDQATVTVNVVESKIEGWIHAASFQDPIAGLELRLVPVDGPDGAPGTAQTDAAGLFQFAALAGRYRIEADPPFLAPIQGDVEVPSGGNANFTPPAIVREARYLTIADFLATAPRQSSLSPKNALLAAVTPGDPNTGGEAEAAANPQQPVQHWYAIEAGEDWNGYTGLEVQLWSDLSRITLRATDKNANRVMATIPTGDPRSVMFLAYEGDARLVRITADPANLDWQPDTSAPSGGAAAGEGEPRDAVTPLAPIQVAPSQHVAVAQQTLAAPISPVDAAEGEASASDTASPASPEFPVVAAPVSDRVAKVQAGLTAEPAEGAANDGSVPTWIAPAAAPPVDGPAASGGRTSPPVDAPVPLSRSDALDAVWSSESMRDEDDRDLVLLASANDAGEYAQAVDWLMSQPWSRQSL